VALSALIFSGGILMYMRNNLRKAILTINTIDHHYTYIKYDLNLKKFYCSKALQDYWQIDSVINDLESINYLIDEKHIRKIYEAIININKGYSSKKFSNFIVKVNAGGNNCFYNCIISPIYSELNNLVMIILNFIDISSYYERDFNNQIIIDEERKKNQLFTTIFDELPQALWVRNKNLELFYSNHSYYELQKDKLAQSDQLPPSFDSEDANIASELLEHKEPICRERHVIVHGKRFLYRFYYYYSSEIDKIITTCIDVNDKHEISQKLNRSIEAQSDLLETTSNASAIFGSDRKLKFYNQAFLDLWGLDENWLDSSPSYELFLDKLRDQRKLPEQANFNSFKKDQLALFTDLRETYNEFFHLPDGKSLRVIVIPYSFGGLLFSYEDMTDKLALESSYNTLMEVQKATLDNLHEGICVFGENGKLRLNNPKYAKMWKLENSFLQTNPHIVEILDASGHMFSSIKELNNHKDSLISAFAKSDSTEHEIHRMDGSIIHRMIMPLPDGSTLLTDYDMTDSAALEKRLREKNIALKDADRIKNEFLANVSFKLRSPLTSIIGLSESLKRKFFGPLNKKQEEYIEGIYNSADQLINLINDIIELTSIDAGYVELNSSEFDVNHAIHEVIYLIRERADNLNINLEYNCQDNIGSMIGDRVRIKQVVFKLLSNAISNTKREDVIYLDIFEDGNNNLNIIVQDTGKGINAGDQDKIFERFYQGDDAENVSSGTGLGLPIVNKFVHLHGGNVYFESEEGKGSKFVCIIPKRNENLNEHNLVAEENYNAFQ
jgi:signal transduction histidine kinase